MRLRLTDSPELADQAQTLTVVDTELEQMIGQIPVPVGPVQFVAFAADGRTASLSLYDEGSGVGELAVFDTRTQDVVTTIPVVGEPESPAVTGDGKRVYVPVEGPNTPSRSSTPRRTRS